MGAQSPAHYIAGASVVMNMIAAAALLECRSTLVEGPAAANAALTEHRALIAPELAQALETVGSYPSIGVMFIVTCRFFASSCRHVPFLCDFTVNNVQSCIHMERVLLTYVDVQHGCTSLHEAVTNADAATVAAIIVAGPKLIDVMDSVGCSRIESDTRTAG